MENSSMTTEKLVEKFQCPGCICGSDTKCGKYEYSDEYNKCMSHVLGTFMLPIGNIALGLPKGFNRPGYNPDKQRTRNEIDIRLHKKGECPEWDNLNVPVWAMEEDDFLFVRTYSPRVNQTWIDVIEGGTLSLCPNAINVGEFIDEID